MFRHRKRPVRAIAALSSIFLLPPVHAAGGLSVEYGEGTNKTDASLRRIGLWWDWAWGRSEGSTSVSGYWEFDIGHWKSAEVGPNHDEVLEVGLAPVLRFRRTIPQAWRPFLDLGVGIQWLSDTRFGGKNISTSIQFSPRVGVGLEFGPQRRFELGYRLLHVSNASIATPNPGLDFHVLRLAYRF